MVGALFFKRARAQCCIVSRMHQRGIRSNIGPLGDVYKMPVLMLERGMFQGYMKYMYIYIEGWSRLYMLEFIEGKEKDWMELFMDVICIFVFVEG